MGSYDSHCQQQAWEDLSLSGWHNLVAEDFTVGSQTSYRPLAWEFFVGEAVGQMLASWPKWPAVCLQRNWPGPGHTAERQCPAGFLSAPVV